MKLEGGEKLVNFGLPRAGTEILFRRRSLALIQCLLGGHVSIIMVNAIRYATMFRDFLVSVSLDFFLFK